MLFFSDCLLQLPNGLLIFFDGHFLFPDRDLPVPDVPESERKNDPRVVRERRAGDAFLGISLVVHDLNLLVDAVQWSHFLNRLLCSLRLSNGFYDHRWVQIIFYNKMK